MDIPALSVAVSQANVMTEYSIAMLSKSLDTMEEHGDMMVKMMERSVTPHLGQNIDISI